jgi:hypothetical protein
MRAESTWTFVAGFALGAAFGSVVTVRRRRALVRDKSISLANDVAEATRRHARGMGHRLRGVVYRAKTRLEDPDVADDVLVERVRAQLGRPVSHPRAIEVRCRNGCVILTGPILASEVDDLIGQVARIAGVRSIQSELDIYDTPGNVPALQH